MDGLLAVQVAHDDARDYNIDAASPNREPVTESSPRLRGGASRLAVVASRAHRRRACAGVVSVGKPASQPTCLSAPFCAADSWPAFRCRSSPSFRSSAAHGVWCTRCMCSRLCGHFGSVRRGKSHAGSTEDSPRSAFAPSARKLLEPDTWPSHKGYRRKVGNWCAGCWRWAARESDMLDVSPWRAPYPSARSGRSALRRSACARSFSRPDARLPRVRPDRTGRSRSSASCTRGSRPQSPMEPIGW